MLSTCCHGFNRLTIAITPKCHSRLTFKYGIWRLGDLVRVDIDSKCLFWNLPGQISARFFFILLYLPVLGTLNIRISSKLEYSIEIVLLVFVYAHARVRLLISWTFRFEIQHEINQIDFLLLLILRFCAIWVNQEVIRTLDSLKDISLWLDVIRGFWNLSSSATFLGEVILHCVSTCHRSSKIYILFFWIRNWREDFLRYCKKLAWLCWL